MGIHLVIDSQCERLVCHDEGNEHFFKKKCSFREENRLQALAREAAMGPKSKKRPEPEEESEEEEEEEEVSDEGSEMEEEEGDDDEVPLPPLTRSFYFLPRLGARGCTTPRRIAGHAEGLLDMVAAAASCCCDLLPSEWRCPFRACCILMGRKATRMERWVDGGGETNGGMGRGRDRRGEGGIGRERAGLA
jgi:hypothetical protein